jgi:hypothetical protein
LRTGRVFGRFGFVGGCVFSERPPTLDAEGFRQLRLQADGILLGKISLIVSELPDRTHRDAVEVVEHRTIHLFEVELEQRAARRAPSHRTQRNLIGLERGATATSPCGDPGGVHRCGGFRAVADS